MTTRRSSSRRDARRRPDTIGVRVNDDPYRDSTVKVATVEAIKYYWPQWYTQVVTADGRIWHYGPWKTEWAARRLVLILARIFLQRGQLTGGVRVE